jgi:hypothetical protein
MPVEAKGVGAHSGYLRETDSTLKGRIKAAGTSGRAAQEQ